MLEVLRIKNIAILKDIEIEFGRGLNLLTGETGAGKSIIAGSLTLLSGERASREMIRAGEDKGTVEAVFRIDKDDRAARLLAEAGIEAEGGEILIRREINPQGGKIYVNNTLQTSRFLKELGPHLIDLHGQHDQQQLMKAESHIDFLDSVGSGKTFRAELSSRFRELKRVESELARVRRDEKEKRRRIDLLTHQVSEIERAGLKKGEEEELKKAKDLLANREKVLSTAHGIYHSLYEREDAVVEVLGRELKNLRELSRWDDGFAGYASGMEELKLQVQELSEALRNLIENLELDPRNLDAVENRLLAIEKLKSKYGDSVEEILAFGEKAREELDSIRTSVERERALDEEYGNALDLYRHCAEELSAIRREDGKKLSKKVEKEFSALALEKASLKVSLETREKRESPILRRGKPVDFDETGFDRVEFLFNANPGERLKPLARIASGGEISRVMLALKSLIHFDSPSKTLIFDEIDSGIGGGRVADQVGLRLRNLSKRNQIICITHISQIAAGAERHFRITKRTLRGRTETIVQPLDEEERVGEIARMLGGAEPTATGLKHAREIVEAKK